MQHSTNNIKIILSLISMYAGLWQRNEFSETRTNMNTMQGGKNLTDGDTARVTGARVGKLSQKVNYPTILENINIKL
jgi:hypothetical protein